MRHIPSTASSGEVSENPSLAARQTVWSTGLPASVSPQRAPRTGERQIQRKNLSLNFEYRSYMKSMRQRSDAEAGRAAPTSL
ncbi:hypothetical protein EVAR_4850_1 [Eumeta japonica]|uniref:Uncharacterized protein n=1 Tax=Eumeta variegata TaxID=151549 RepID=A0A4C1T004_EUMVA|nr:hypothetical protein EVAR_4850_1 [Eumeta japonica]